MNEHEGRRHARVGLMVVAAVAVLGVLLLLKGADRLPGRSRVFYVELPSVEGLAAGSEVLLRGYRVGHVDHVDLMGGMDPRFRVQVRLDRRLSLSRGTTALLLPKGLTAAYLDLRLPASPGALLEPGSTLAGEAGPTLASLLVRADATLTGLTQVSGRLGKEGLTSLLDHPELRLLMADLRSLTQEAQGTTRDAHALVRQGQGLVARNTPAVERSLASLERNLAGAEAGLRDLRAYVEAHREDFDRLPGATLGAVERVDRAGARAEALMTQAAPTLETLDGALASLEELLEILKAKPNRVVFGRVSPQELEAARARIRSRRAAPAR